MLQETTKIVFFHKNTAASIMEAAVLFSIMLRKYLTNCGRLILFCVVYRKQEAIKSKLFHHIAVLFFIPDIPVFSARGQ